jgi:hypothetical protein
MPTKPRTDLLLQSQQAGQKARPLKGMRFPLRLDGPLTVSNSRCKGKLAINALGARANVKDGVRRPPELFFSRSAGTDRGTGRSESMTEQQTKPDQPRKIE